MCLINFILTLEEEGALINVNVNTSSSLRSLIDSNDSSSFGQKHQALTNGQGPSAYSTPRNHNGIGKSFSEVQEPCSALYKPKCALNLNYLYTMIEDSEETQRNVDANGTYLKTGTYQPLQKETKQLEPLKPKDPYGESQWQRKAAPKALPPPAPEVREDPPPEIRKDPSPMPRPEPEPERIRDVRSYTNPFSLIGREVTRQLYEFSEEVLELEHLERFFKKQFTRNYVSSLSKSPILPICIPQLLFQYPDFFELCQDDFIDVRAIILQCESASYQHVYQAIHDLRRIAFAVRCYLKVPKV